jgi:hypothetical protein
MAIKFALPWRRRSSRSRKRLDYRSTPDFRQEVGCSFHGGSWLRLFKKSGRDGARVEAVDRSFM